MPIQYRPPGRGPNAKPRVQHISFPDWIRKALTIGPVNSWQPLGRDAANLANAVTRGTGITSAPNNNPPPPSNTPGSSWQASPVGVNYNGYPAGYIPGRGIPTSAIFGGIPPGGTSYLTPEDYNLLLQSGVINQPVNSPGIPGAANTPPPQYQPNYGGMSWGSIQNFISHGTTAQKAGPGKMNKAAFEWLRKRRQEGKEKRQEAIANAQSRRTGAPNVNGWLGRMAQWRTR